MHRVDRRGSGTAPAPTKLARPRPRVGARSRGQDEVDENAKAMTLVGVDGVNLTGAGNRLRADGRRPAPARARARARPARRPPRRELVEQDQRLLGAARARRRSASTREDRRSGVARSPARPVAQRRLGRRLGRPRVARSRATTAGPRRGSSPTCAPTCRAGDSLTVCITAATSLGAYAAMGYDLPALAASVDQIVLMTLRRPRPVGEDARADRPARLAARLRRGARAGRRRRTQIFLGVANYAYAWRPHSGRVAHGRAGARTRQAPGTRGRDWIANAGEWTREAPRRLDGSGGRTSGR